MHPRSSADLCMQAQPSNQALHKNSRVAALSSFNERQKALPQSVAVPSAAKANFTLLVEGWQLLLWPFAYASVAGLQRRRCVGFSPSLVLGS